MTPSKAPEITVVLTPFERYSGLDKAVDRLFTAIDRPIKLLVLEAGAPDPMRAALEKRQKKHPRTMKVLYTKRHLSSGCLMNLALQQVKTPLVFFLGGDVLVDPAALCETLDRACLRRADIVSASVRKEVDMSVFIRPGGLPAVHVEACIFDTACLKSLGGFNERLPHFLLGMDIMAKAKLRNKTIENVNSSDFSIPANTAPFNRSDLHLFFHQWNVVQLRRSLEALKSEVALPVQPEVLRGIYRQQKALAREALLGLRVKGAWIGPIQGLRHLARTFISL